MIHNASVHEIFFVESTRTYQIKTKVETDDEGSHTSGFGENPIMKPIPLVRTVIS